MPVLVVCNAIFILPPLLLAAVYGLFGARMRGRFERGSRGTSLWVLGIVGFPLLADSLSFFDFFGLV